MFVVKFAIFVAVLYLIDQFALDGAGVSWIKRKLGK